MEIEIECKFPSKLSANAYIKMPCMPKQGDEIRFYIATDVQNVKQYKSYIVSVVGYEVDANNIAKPYVVLSNHGY